MMNPNRSVTRGDIPLDPAAVTDQSSARATQASTYASQPRRRCRCPRRAGAPTNAAKDMAGLRCLHDAWSVVQWNARLRPFTGEAIPFAGWIALFFAS